MSDSSNKPKSQGGDLFIVDNSDSEWKVLRYLREWADISNTFDVATGNFEIGSLLALDGEWQKLNKLRILMGDEVTKRTNKAIADAVAGLGQHLNDSVEAEKERNDFLVGVPAIVEAMRSGKIECKVFTKKKFHAKCYITHAKHEVVGSAALVGSSNFTYPGLTENVELNVQVKSEVAELQEWYEDMWEQAEDVTSDMLKVIERHTRGYSPFEVYVKALQEFFRGHETTAGEWEEHESRMYPVLDHYQQDGYHAMLKVARRHKGAFLCDGVGLGKTFVGLMLIERLVQQEGKRVLLLAPKAVREDVWDRDIAHYLSHIGSRDYSSLVVLNHTDLNREGDYPARLAGIKNMADVVVIDEAHHFRNPGIKGEGEHRPSRYRVLHDLLEGPNGVKQLFLLTATPINNQLADFRHMAELFAREDNYFASTLGVHSLRGHFNTMEKELKKLTGESGGDDTETNMAEAEQVLLSDELFRHLVVQRSRSYVKESQIQHGDSVTCFPERAKPKVAEYSVKKTYGRLLNMVDTACKREKPLLSLALYYPLAYYIGPDIEKQERAWLEGRQEAVVSLIRTGLLKRFESSAEAFECSCDRLLIKLLAWVERHSETDTDKRRLERWKGQNAEVIGYVHDHQLELFGDEDTDPDEDLVSEEMLADVEPLSADEYKVDEILDETFLDLDQIAKFLEELRKFDAKHDAKLETLVKLLKTDPVLKKHKVLIFSEFADTARYLKNQLNKAKIGGVEQIDSGLKKDRGQIIKRFAPYYNGSSSPELEESGQSEIRVLISTDVLSEGLNLQDATRLINYDLHWNPVRLMQRIGRVDRRMNPETEEAILRDHPDQKKMRGKVAYWNFLPPAELNELLTLYTRVSHKTLRISKTFGIEGKKLLTPEDDYDALREFNEKYEGQSTPLENMHLEYQQLLTDDTSLEERLNALPGRVFSGKKLPKKGTKAVFFCYALPRRDMTATEEGGEPQWTEEAGEAKWYLYEIDTKAIHEEPSEIVEVIRCKPKTPRYCETEHATLAEIRKKVEKHIKNTYLKKFQAPVGVKPVLKCWMELCQGGQA